MSFMEANPAFLDFLNYVVEIPNFTFLSGEVETDFLG